MKSGEIRRFLNVYVNEEDIRFLGGNKYAFQDGDEVLLVPSIAGGGAVASLHPEWSTGFGRETSGGVEGPATVAVLLRLQMFVACRTIATLPAAL